MLSPLYKILEGFLWALVAEVPRNSMSLVRWIWRMTSFLLYTLLGQVDDILTVAVVENVTLSCSNISSGHGYLYPVLPKVLLVLLINKDCEQAWYSKTLEFLSDGTPLCFMNGTRHPLVVDVYKNNITVSDCVELRHHVTCHGLEKTFEITYQVLNTMPDQPIEEAIKNTLVSVFVPVFIFLLLLIAAAVLITIRHKKNQRAYNMNESPANHNGEVYRLNTDSESEEHAL